MMVRRSCVKLSRIKVDGKALVAPQALQAQWRQKEEAKSEVPVVDVSTDEPATKRQRQKRPRRRPPPPPAQAMRTLAPSTWTHPSVRQYARDGLSGRLLARKLILGDTVVVNDRLPLFVIEYLQTDNTLSLNELSTALEALESVEPNHTNLLKQILKDGVDATIQAMMIEDLQVCDLYPPGFVCRLTSTRKRG